MLQNEPLVAKIGVDTAENEPIFGVRLEEAGAGLGEARRWRRGSTPARLKNLTSKYE